MSRPAKDRCRDAAAAVAALTGLSRRRKYLVGVSGGADSMALLRALREAGFRNLVVCHFAHGIRIESADREARFVARAARGFRFRRGEGDSKLHARTRKISLEQAARELRYAFFEKCARAEGCGRLLLAHHAMDQFETILLNLFRGTGLAGLCGMAPESRIGRLTVIRPFLAIWPEELREFLAARRAGFCEDPTNSDPSFARNRLRARVLPVIREGFGESALRCAVRAAGLLREDSVYLESSVPDLPECPGTRELAGLPPPILGRALLRWLRAGGVPEPGSAEVSRVISLLGSDGAPAKVNLPGGFHARRRNRKIFLEFPGGKNMSSHP